MLCGWADGCAKEREREREVVEKRSGWTCVFACVLVNQTPSQLPPRAGEHGTKWPGKDSRRLCCPCGPAPYVPDYGERTAGVLQPGARASIGSHGGWRLCLLSTFLRISLAMEILEIVLGLLTTHSSATAVNFQRSLNLELNPHARRHAQQSRVSLALNPGNGLRVTRRRRVSPGALEIGLREKFVKLWKRRFLFQSSPPRVSFLAFSSLREAGGIPLLRPPVLSVCYQTRLTRIEIQSQPATLFSPLSRGDERGGTCFDLIRKRFGCGNCTVGRFFFERLPLFQKAYKH